MYRVLLYPVSLVVHILHHIRILRKLIRILCTCKYRCISQLRKIITITNIHLPPPPGSYLLIFPGKHCLEFGFFSPSHVLYNLACITVFLSS